MSLGLTRNTYEAMVRHARQAYPLECCGMLAGNDGLVSAVFPIANQLDRAESYRMDPVELIRFFKEIRKASLLHLGIYHSHPTTQAYPSRRDIRESYYPDCAYFIISLENLEAPVIQAFRIRAGQVDREEFHLS